MLRRLWSWWLDEWDFIAIWMVILIVGMLMAGAVSTTLDALAYARAYH